MDTPDEIELQTQAALSSVAQSLNKRLNGVCTVEVKKILGTLGSSLGCEVRPSGTGQHRSREWLLERGWCTRSD